MLALPQTPLAARRGIAAKAQTERSAACPSAQARASVAPTLSFMRKKNKNPFRVGRSRTGLGLFAIEPIPNRVLIVEYRGRRIPTVHAQEIEQQRGAKYMLDRKSVV